jgi:DNA-binding Xre family transcriptional regulator
LKVGRNKLDIQLAKQVTTLSALQDEIAPATLARIRRGEGNISPKTVGRLAQVLHCQVEDLLEEV